MSNNHTSEHQNSDAESTPPREASLADVSVALGTVISLLALSVYMFGSDSSGGANQIALIIGGALAVFIGIKNGHRWAVIEKSIVSGVAVALPAIMILFSVGSLIGAWMLSGTVPSMIYYGLKLLDPAYFYPASLIICAVTALSIGSSWTVAGTIGIGLMGVAGGLGLSPAITAGAVISGAYFGDKMSPLSDTTNLAPAVTGIDLFTHIRHMTWTTTPSILLALIIFSGIGFFQQPAAGDVSLADTLAVLEANFSINIILLLPVAVVVYMAAKRVPAVAAILTGALVGCLLALIFQRDVILAFVADASLSTPAALLKGIWTVLFSGYSADTGHADMDDLLSRGGMSSMLNTIWLIITAMVFGAAMEKVGILARLVRSLLSLGHSVGGLIATTVATCFGVNVLAADQYIAIVLPGRMYKAEYHKRGLHEKNLSRVLEDTGTITSPLIPWNTCGAFMAATLGVPTLVYLPFCFFNLINPFVSIAYGFLNFTITPIDPEQSSAADIEGVALQERLGAG